MLNEKINPLDLLAMQLDMQHPVHLVVAYLCVSPLVVFWHSEVQHHAHPKLFVVPKLGPH